MGNAFTLPQVLTKNRAPVAFTFSHSDRFGFYDRIREKNRTPGPGSYVN